MSKCSACPIAGQCVAERPGYDFACKFAVGSDAEKLWLANQSAKLQGKPPAEYPSIVTQAGNLGKALVGFAKSGFKTVDDETHQARLAICQGCDQYDADQRRCKHCGCRTSAKLRMASESCPLPEPKWAAITAQTTDGGPALEQGVGSSVIDPAPVHVDAG